MELMVELRGQCVHFQSTTKRPYEGSGDSQQSPYEPGRMDNDEHFKVFLQSVGQE